MVEKSLKRKSCIFREKTRNEKSSDTYFKSSVVFFCGYDEQMVDVMRLDCLCRNHNKFNVRYQSQ